MNNCYLQRVQVLLLMGSILMIFGVIGCKKKDRLTTSSVIFSITPPAATVVKGNTQTLSATANAGGGASPVTAEWAVSSSDGSLNTSVGSSVVFTGNALGDVTVTATFDGSVATSQIAIVTFMPGSQTYDVYSDDGFPITNGVAADVETNASANPSPGDFALNELSTGYTPEGNNYMRAENAAGLSRWSVDLAIGQAGLTTDLSSFSTLRFSIRLERDLGPADFINIEIQDNASATQAVRSDSWVGFTSTGNVDWQEVSIPASSFFGGVDETQIRVPFRASKEPGVAAALTFDIDAVRWE